VLEVWVDAWPPPVEPEPVEDEPEVEVWVCADEPFAPAPPADDDPDALVVVDAAFDELPEDDGGVVEVPVGGHPGAELGAVVPDPAWPEDGLVAEAPVFVCVFEDEPPPAAEAEPAVLVFADDEPEEVVVDACVEVVVLAWAPDEGDGAGLEGVVGVGVGVGDAGVVAVVVVWVFEVVGPAGFELGEAEAWDVHHFDEKLVVVFPDVCEPDTATGGETVTVGAGVVLAAVFELLCVLEVPPLTDGEIVNVG